MAYVCPFCEILAGRGPGSIFYEDDLVFGLMDVAPITRGHALVIPKAHVTCLAELDEATGQRLFTVAQRTAAALRGSGVRCEGVNLWLADGKAAFQDVFHVHLHVIPRYVGDGFKLDVSWPERPSRAELDDLAAAIREAYVEA